MAEQCSHKVSPSKIEIKLKKLEEIRWTTLEGNRDTKENKVTPIPAGKL